MSLSLFRGAPAARTAYVIQRETDTAALDGILNQERMLAAYALAQLEPKAMEVAQWWTTRTNSGLALLCHSRAGLGDATFAMGPPDGVRAMLSIHPGPHITFATSWPKHRSALEATYVLSGGQTMHRMHVTQASFRPLSGETVRLRGASIRMINRLYAAGYGPGNYQAHHIDDGCYCGHLVDGRLVAVAGTHSISPSAGIAVVGNVFTHPQHRGHGYATLVTSAVTAELLRTLRDVVLSVDPSNTPAVQAYRTLGYVPVDEIVESAARRHGSNVSAGLRRTFAGRRGQRHGTEVVYQ